MRYVASALLILATAALSLPSFGALIETNTWWLRMTDFPRLQYLIGLGVLLVIIAVAWPINGKLRSVLAVIALLATGGSQLAMRL